MEIQRAKSILWIVCKGVIVILAFLFILTKCSGCDNKIDVTPRNYDSLFAKIKADSIWKIANQKKYDSLEVKLLAASHNSDSLVRVKNKAEKNYQVASKTVRDLLKRGICDTNVIIIALNDCDSLNEANKAVIASKDTVIDVLTKEKNNLLEDKAKSAETLQTAKNIIQGKDKDYADLKTASKKALRKQKVITWLIIIGDAIKDAALIFLLK